MSMATRAAEKRMNIFEACDSYVGVSSVVACTGNRTVSASESQHQTVLLPGSDLEEKRSDIKRKLSLDQVVVPGFLKYCTTVPYSLPSGHAQR